MKTFEKSTDGKLKEIHTTTIEKKYSLKDLRKQKQFLKNKLDEIQALIDEAVKLNVGE